MGQIKNIKLHIVTDIKKMKRRFCELNVVESSSNNSNLQNIKQLLKLGYHAVAINREMKPPKNVNKNTPKMSNSEIHSFAQSMVKLQQMVNELKKAATPPPTTTTTATTTPSITTKATKSAATDTDFIVPDDFELLSRITVELDNPGQGRLLKSSPYKDMLNDVDIIAICPTSEAVLKSILEGRIECDIIALRLENELPFNLTTKTIALATRLNLSFEISYGHAIKSVSLRKYILQNGRMLAQRSKRARGLIMSCNGDNYLDFRSPRDVINLAHLFDVSDNVSHDVVSKNCWAAITHAKLRKHTYLGAV